MRNLRFRAVMILGLAVPGVLQADTLADALVSTYLTNPQLTVQRATVRGTDEDVIAARSNLLPNASQTLTLNQSKDLGHSVAQNPGNATATISTTITQQLYDGGADRLNVEAAKMLVLAARQDLKTTEQSVLLSALTAYMDVRRDQEFVRLAINNIRVLEEQVRAARDRFEVGEVTRTDVAQAEARLAAARSGLASNRGALARSVDQYTAVVGKPPHALATPPAAPQIPATPAAAEAVALKKHPRILQAQFLSKARDLGWQAAKKNKHPNVSAQLQHTFTDRVGLNGAVVTNQLSASVSATVPIYQGGRLDSNQRGAFADLEAALGNVQLQGLITRQSVANAYTTWQVARASIISNREQVRAAEVAFEGVSEEALFGQRTTLDALDAEQELLTAKSNLVSAVRDEYVARYTVLSEMGLMTAEHLNLGVPLYNPDVYYSASTQDQRKPLSKVRIKAFDALKKRYGN